MDKLPGPLLYELAKYVGMLGIPVLEIFNSRIQKKLLGSLSAF